LRLNEIRELSPAELTIKLEEKAEEMANIRFQLALHQQDNTATIRIARRELARMKTVMNEHLKGIRVLKGESKAAKDIL